MLRQNLANMRMGSHSRKLILILIVILASAATSRAAITLTIQEIGSDVEASYTGTLDTTNMNFTGNLLGSPVKINPSEGLFYADIVDSHSEATSPWNQAPTAFGSGGEELPESVSVSSGNSFSFSPSVVRLSNSFFSGDSLDGSLTFENETLQTLGITPGTYNATFGSGDTFTINAIPEPSSYGFLLGAAGLATAIFCRRRRRPSAV